MNATRLMNSLPLYSLKEIYKLKVIKYSLTKSKSEGFISGCMHAYIYLASCNSNNAYIASCILHACLHTFFLGGESISVPLASTIYKVLAFSMLKGPHRVVGLTWTMLSRRVRTSFCCVSSKQRI